LPDARDGRLCRHGGNPPPRAAARPRARAAHHRHHRQRAAGRPRIVPGRRHGRLPEQALHAAGLGHTLARWITLPRAPPCTTASSGSARNAAALRRGAARPPASR
jgi:hypothetical protein